MNAINPMLELETNALSGDLRPRERSPRPIPCSETRPTDQFGALR